MNTKKLAITIVFAALTITLNPALTGIGVPAPYAPFLIYQLWEIPIVATFLLIGVSSGILITLLNTSILLAIFPGALPTGPIYNLIAVLSMLLGIYVSQRIFSKEQNHSKSSLRKKATTTTISTVFGLLFRVGTMAFINYTLLGYPPPIGYSLPVQVIVGYLPLIMLFNATLTLYTIPIGHIITKKAQDSLKINKQ